MKKLLLITAALGVLCASTAFAHGVNLSWTKCPTTASGGANLNNTCDGTVGLKTLTGSFKADQSIGDFAAIDAAIDLGFVSGINGSWTFDTGGCNASAFSLTTPGTAPGCPTALFQTATSFGAFVISYPHANQERIQISYVNGSGVPTAVNAGQQYSGVAATIDFDGAFNNGCAGCLEPVSLVLNNITVSGFATTETPESIDGQDTRQCVTYNGPATFAGCPAATPSRNETWGKVKTLYR
jgi:hypothetical protein